MNKKYLIASILAVLLAVLIGINLNQSKEAETKALAGTLTIETEGKTLDFAYDEGSSAFAAFDTQMKRKNGDVFDKNYSGMELQALLKEAGLAVTQDTSVTAVCKDNYMIELTGSEVLEQGNVYLVTREHGEPLSEENGPFMLVINNDEFSTRWAKQIVSLSVK